MTLAALVIADDLTGALEAGAKFAGRGIPATVTCDRDAAPASAPVLVIDTETRHVPAADAAAVVARIARRAQGWQPAVIYKKTDSTLRGNIAAELRALTGAFPGRELMYVAAYPAMGRTVHRGMLYVHGVPVHQTAFGSDAMNAVAASDLRSLLGDIRASIPDGATDQDVLAAAKLNPPLVAGPAAIGEALALCMEIERSPAREFPKLARCLVVNGSLHRTSHGQIEEARRTGLFDSGWRLFHYEGGGEGLERAMRVGKQVKQALCQNPVDGVIVFGGDSAYGLHAMLGGGAFDPYGEIFPGIPFSESNGLYWITKAGGFGEPDVLSKLFQRLT